tara:strand:- start:329 stop:700 length:372 start_codon:yes stop_codon:yes gene_type:complete
MKKLTISVAILLSSVVAKAQTEFVELSSNKLFKRSYAKYYNDSGIPLEEDLSVSIVKGNLNYHWVKYYNAEEVQVICADKENAYRKICVNENCNTYNTYNEIYTFKLSGVLDTLKFYKPSYNE